MLVERAEHGGWELDRVRVGVDLGQRSQRRRRAAVVRVAVPEHDSRDPAEVRRGGGDRPGHPLLARIEDDDPATVVADEVDVHRPGQPAPQEPHPVGDGLRRGTLQASQPGPATDRWRALRRRPDIGPIDYVHVRQAKDRNSISGIGLARAVCLPGGLGMV